MPDTAAPLLWILAAASACLGLLVSNARNTDQSLPGFYDLPWWQDIATRYRLAGNEQASAARYAEGCVSAVISGEGFHRTIRYQLLCPPGLFSPNGHEPVQVTILQPLQSELFVDPYELGQSNAVLSGSIEVEPFGHFDLEQPSPACHPTVLGLTLPTSLRRERWEGSRPVFHAFELPFHAKYPAPVEGGASCSAADVLRLSPGPMHVSTWASPLLLVVTDSQPGDSAGGGTKERPVAELPSGSADPASDATPGADSALHATALSPRNQEVNELYEDWRREEEEDWNEGLHRSGRSAGGGKRQWSLTRVRLAQPGAVEVPTGCMLHGGLVSAVTLATVVMCGAAVVLAALR